MPTPQRKKLKAARAEAMKLAPEVHGIAPEDVMVEVLERAVSLMRFTEDQADKLKPDDMWIDTNAGGMAHHWIRMSTDYRQEVCYVAGRMLGLEIESRRAIAAETMAEALAPVFREVFENLNLTPAQKKRVPAAVLGGLQLLEGGKS